MRKFINGMGCGLLLGIVIVVIVLGGVLGYILPKNTGDQFANSLRGGDFAAIEATICDHTTTRDVLGTVRGGGDQLSGFVADLLGVPVVLLNDNLTRGLLLEASYDVLSSIYTFNYRISGDVDAGLIQIQGLNMETPPIQLTIDRSNPLQPCIAG